MQLWENFQPVFSPEIDHTTHGTMERHVPEALMKERTKTMKKQMMALLMAAAMLLALAGCGEEKGSANRHEDDPTGSTAGQSDTDGSTNSRTRGSAGDRAFNNNHGSTFGGAGEAIEDEARQGGRYGTIHRPDADGTATWHQMLDNGFVHDSDGFLLDGENASWH